MSFPRSTRPVLLAVCLLLGLAAAAEALEGRIVDRRTGRPIAGAEVSIVGLTGSVRTDADGRFSWKPDPRPPFLVLIVLPGGQVAKPVYVEQVDWAAVLTLEADSTFAQEITVSGVAPSIDAAPGAGMTLVSGIEVARRAPANLTQALENVPGVSQVSEGQAAVPAVRGLARGRTLILVDGSRVSTERRAGPSATFLDPGSIDGIDVARGPGSVAYGSDAFGGVISVRTRRPDYNTPFKARVAGTLGAGVPDRFADVEVSSGFGSGGVLVQARSRSADNYEGPDGPVFNSGWRDRGVLVRAERRFGRSVLSGGWQGDFGRDVERPRNNSRDVRFFYPFENSHRVSASWEHSGAGAFSQMKLVTFIGTYEQRTDQDRTPTPTRARRIERADVSAKDFQVRFTAERPLGEAKLEFGVDVNGRFDLEARDVTVNFNLAGDMTSTINTASIASARRTNTGVFLQAETPLGTKTTLAGGARVDVVKSTNRGGFFGTRSMSAEAMAGFGAVTLGPFEGFTFTAQLSRGFRDPTLSDRFFRGPSGRGFITGNPDLRSETSLQTDLGVRYASGRLRVAAYVYDYRIRHLVERYTTGDDLFFFRNRGRARLRGLELEAQATLGRGYTVEIAGQIGDGRALDDDAPLDDVAAPSLSVLVRKSFGERWQTHLRAAAAARDAEAGPSEVASPGRVLVDAGVSWKAADRFELRGSARNLLDRAYYASPDPRFVLAPGRSISLTAVVTF